MAEREQVDPKAATITASVERAWGEALGSEAPPGATIKRRATVRDEEAPPERISAAKTVRSEEGGAGATATMPSPVPEGPPAFEVIRKVGQGGMGVVYAARQAALGREVALKMVKPEHRESALAADRFIAEALVTGELDHPNIVPVHDLGRDRAGDLYMAMKLIRGTGWDRLLHPETDPEATARPPDARKPMGLRDHLEVLLRVCDAVAFAHSRSIIHRDLKPENVIVGRFGEVVVMDWGIALDVSEAPPPQGASKAEHKSRTSGPAGTPCYMAPELATGDVEKIGPRSDVYLLGAILYEILSGAPPHDGPSVRMVLLAAATGAVEPPERRAKGRPVPRELSRICMRALALRPEDRYEDVAAFQAAVKEYLAHEESLKLADAAAQDLARLRDAGKVPAEERYGLFASCVARFGEALRLWPGNDEARAGEARAALAYAEEAFDRDDVGLASAQLQRLSSEGGGLSPADANRLQDLRAAIAARRARRRRAVVAGAVIILAIALVSAALSSLGESARTAAEAAKREERARTALQAGWKAAREADLGALAVARSKLAEVATDGCEGGKVERAEERLEGLDLAREALLLSAGRPEEVLAGEGLPSVTKSLALRLAALPAVSGTALAEDLLRAGTSDERGPPLGRVLAGAVASAAPRRALAAALEGGLGVAKLSREREALRRRALADFGERMTPFPDVRETSLGSWEEVLGLARWPAEARTLPFGVMEDPARLPRRDDVLPEVRRDPDGSFVAIDSGAGPSLRKVVWRAAPFGERPSCERPLVFGDGSVILAGPGQLVRLSGSTGAVLGRAWLDGDAVVALPDPLDPEAILLLVTLRESLGEVHPVRVKAGRLDPPYSQGENMGFVMGPRAAADAERRRLAASGASGSGLSTWLLHAGESDPTNPFYALAALDALGPTATAEARAVPGRAAAKAMHAALARDAGNPIIQACYVAGLLYDADLLPEADALVDAAAARFLDLGGNPDLDFALIMNPALHLRRAGGKLFARGEVGKSLELVESGRRFSTIMEADQWFYANEAAWMRWKGRDAEADRARLRAREAAKGGGGLSLFPRMYVDLTDIVIYATGTLPFVLFFLTWRLWHRARRGVLADLRARGMRTAAERTIAWATHPVERLRYSFLSYATRGERLSLAVVAILFLVAASFTAGAVRTITEVTSMAFSLGNGHAGNDVVTRFIEDRHRASGERPFSLRVLAEGRVRRGEPAAARALYERALALEPSDPVAATGIAVCDELSGDLARAKQGYARASSLATVEDARGAAARWNEARLAGRFDGLSPEARTETAEWRALAHRDRLHADRDGPSRPLLASCPHADIFAVILQERASAAAFLRDGFSSLVAGRFSALTHIQMEGVTSDSFFGLVVDVAGYGSIALALLGLLWLPARVLALPPAEAAALLDEAAAKRARAKRIGQALVGLAVPGLHDLATGSAARGAALLEAFIVAVAVRAVMGGAGIIGSIAVPSIGAGYFADAPEGVLTSGASAGVLSATIAIAILYVANAASIVRGMRAPPA